MIPKNVDLSLDELLRKQLIALLSRANPKDLSHYYQRGIAGMAMKCYPACDSIGLPGG